MHKAQYLIQKLEQEPNTRLILVGHSVGAYICLQLLRHVPADRVVAVWGLYPTIMVCVVSTSKHAYMCFFSLLSFVFYIRLSTCLFTFI